MSGSSLSPRIQERMRSLEELTEFTQSCQNELQDLCQALGWTQESDARLHMEVCPYDPNHTVPRHRMEKHKAACHLAQLGYSREERAEMMDPSVFYEKANVPSVIIDKATLQQVLLQAGTKAPLLRAPGLHAINSPEVPQNHKRAVCDLTGAERLALYNHVIREVGQQSLNRESNEDLYVDLVAKLKKEEKAKGPKTHLEVLAEMRDYRRRRQSYRAKNVHITKKSYTEVIREVIDVHSGELARIWQEEREEETRSSHQSSHGRSRSELHSRSPSFESRDSKISSQEVHGHKHHHKHSHSHKHKREKKKKRKRESHSTSEEKHHKKKKKKKD